MGTTIQDGGKRERNMYVIVYLNPYILIDFLWFSFSVVFYFFYFLNNEEVCDYGHMTYHMTFYYKA